MSITVEAFALLLLLVPGFLTSKILNAIAVRRDKGHMAEIIEALVFSVLIYAVLHAVGWSLVTMNESDGGYARQVDFKYVPHAFVLAGALALALGISINRDWHMGLLRRLGITAGTARINTWVDVFTDHDSDVLITYKDGRRLTGWPAYFSDGPEEGLLYLRNPAWINDRGEVQEIGVDGSLILNKGDIESISFVNGIIDSEIASVQEGGKNA